MKDSKKKMNLASLDSIFTTQEERDEAKKEHVINLPIEQIQDFPEHPFKVLDNAEMDDLVKSISVKGVILPTIVRQREDGSYEMISGHRRKHAALRAGLTEIPCIIKDLTDDEATILMVDSNIQREEILPSEKAFAYKMKLEAMKHQGKNLTSDPMEQKQTSREVLAEKVGESASNIQRFIRLTYLIPELLELVDEKRIALRPAVELSYISEDNQEILYDIFKYDEATPTLSQAQILRKLDEKGETEDVTGLPLGKYKVKEKTAGEGYFIDNTKYPVSLTYKDQNTKVITNKTTSNEQVKKMGVHIFKSGINIQSGLVQGLEGAEFSIKLNSAVEKAYSQGYSYAEVWSGLDENGNKVSVDANRVSQAQLIAPTYEIITTNSEGNAYTQNKLPYGKYIVKESKTPVDFEPAVDFSFSITKDESEIQEVAQKVKHLVVNDEQLESYIKLVKKDLKSNKIVTLNSATFEIKAASDIIDRGNGKTLYRKGDKITQKLGSTTYSSFTTNADNEVIPDYSYNSDNDGKGIAITPLSLPVGKYEITEIRIPTGFLQLEAPVKFEIKNVKDFDTDKDGDFIKEVIVKNEQPTGTLKVNKTVAIRENVDTSLINISDLSGIQFKLTAKEDIIDMADGSKFYTKGQAVGTYNLTKEGKLTIDNLPMGTYELQEIKTLDGLVLNNKKYEVKFVKVDDITKVYTENRKISNDTTIFELSKTDITGEAELEGAKLTVLDGDKVVDTWISSDKTHKIEGLVAGKEYTLREEITPNAYVKATDIKFKVENTKDVQKVTMIDKIVELTKTDIGGEEVEGAKIQVLDGEKIIDEWTSGKEAHKINGLEEGKTYILHEEVAPDGYVKATDVEFTVTTDKETQHEKLVNKIVKVSKTDLTNGEELEGAELEITDVEGNVIENWTSTKEPHIVNGLEEGKTYTLTEKTAPYGYEMTESITFTVTTDKETQIIEMKDMPILKNVKIIKVDAESKEVIKDKFTFAIYEDQEGTKLIKEVKSDKEEGTAIFEELRFGTYFIKEIKAPKGYELSDRVVKVEINGKGVFIDDELTEESDNTVTFNFENKKIEVPKTGDNSHIKLALGILLLATLGLAYFGIKIYKSHKDNNNK